jgi:hypothetical protein
MAVYVDDARIPYRRMLMCHMLADTLEELHEMAERLGVREHFEQSNRGVPHYDICRSKRRLALKLGAVEAGRREIGALARAWRK